MNKRILFEIAHPKHFHQFKYLINKLGNKFDIKIIARDKDVVIELLEESDLPYMEYGIHGKSMVEKITAVPTILFMYYKIVREFNPDIIVSRSSPYAAIISKFHDCKTIVFPDSEVVSFNNNFVVPLSDYVVTPSTYSLDHGQKHQKVNGFFENAYLHPNYFEKDSSVLSDLGIQKGDTLFLIRFVGWFANHDTDNHGFTEQQKIDLVEFLNTKGKVLISGEGELSKELRPYQLDIDASKMHSLLSYCSLYIGDSQTMATEAALLGTPAIRYNSFVGEDDMSNFKILENKYGLLKNASSYTEVFETAEKILSQPHIKKEYNDKRLKYFEETGDVNQETEEIIINYLNSSN